MAVHIGLGPPGTAYPSRPRWSTRRTSAVGCPLLLEDVLVRHPRMRIWVMHAGWRADAQLTFGRSSALRFSESYLRCAQQFDQAAIEAIRTRLGDDAVLVELPPSAAGIPPLYGSGAPAREITLPIRVLGGADIPPVTDWRAEPNTIAFRLGSVSVSYGFSGIEWTRR